MLGAGASKHKPLTWPLLCRPTILAPRARKMSGAIFGRGAFSTRRAEAVYAQALRILRTGRKQCPDFETARPATGKLTFPRSGVGTVSCRSAARSSSIRAVIPGPFLRTCGRHADSAQCGRPPGRGEVCPSTEMRAYMLDCASIIAQPLESKEIKKILSTTMQGNYAGFAQSVVVFFARQALAGSWHAGLVSSWFHREGLPGAPGRRVSRVKLSYL